MTNKIAFIGAGSMAESIISGILSSGYLMNEQIFVTNKNDHDRLEKLEQKYGINCSANKEKVIAGADIVILSMKPHDLTNAISSIKNRLSPNQLIISVVAGITTQYIASKLSDGQFPVVRAMPNTSAAIGYSATAICAGHYASDYNLRQAKDLFDTIGSTTIVDETDMHTITAISGSGVTAKLK